MASIVANRATRILVVDDDELLRRSLKYRLGQEGYAVTTAEAGEQALSFARHDRPDLVLIDIGLPDRDGLDVARAIQREVAVPIIFLTGRRQETDIVVGLEMGAEDYVTKPFGMRELLARIRTVLRRTARLPSSVESESLTVSDISMDVKAHEVIALGNKIDLPPKEFELLRLLLTNAGSVLTTEYLLDAVWGEEFAGATQVLYVHIGWLREAIEPDPRHPCRIVTVRGGWLQAGSPGGRCLMRSLYIKMIASHTLPILALMPILTLYLLFNLEGFLNQSMLVELKGQAFLLRERIESEPGLVDNREAAQSFLAATERMTGARIFIIARDLTIVASSRPEDARFTGMLLADADVDKALNGEEIAGVGPGFGTDVAYVVLPIRYEGITRAAVRISYDLSDVRSEFAEVQRVVVGGVGLTLLPGLALGLGLATTIARPLHRMSDNVERMANGDYSVRAQAQGHSEVASVARNLSRMAERLEEAEHSRERQLAAIVHELARPLTGLRAAVDTLRDDAELETEDRAMLLEGVAGELTRLQRLVDTLQQMQKRRVRQLVLHCTRVSLDRILRATAANYQSLAAQSDINLVLELPTGTPLIWVDEDRLIQVLTNLLDNAFKFTPRGGTVSIHAAVDQMTALVSVADSGSGIPPEEQPFVFQEFFRGRDSHAPEKHGMGLGLAICRDIITAHGGAIKLSTPRGGGTCIEFTVPVRAHVEQP